MPDKVTSNPASPSFDAPSLSSPEQTEEGGLMKSPPPFQLAAGTPPPNSNGGGQGGAGDSPASGSMMLANASRTTTQAQSQPQDLSDPEAAAERLHRAIQAYPTNRDTGLVFFFSDTPDADRAAMVAAYRRRYGIHPSLALHQLWANGTEHERWQLFAATTWLSAGGLASTDQTDASLTESTLRAEEGRELLPGQDENFGYSRFSFNVSGRFAAVGNEIELTHAHTQQFYSAPGSRVRRPYMERVTVGRDRGAEFYEFRRAENQPQSVRFTPRGAGSFAVVVYLRHPDGHLEIRDLFITVKPIEEIAQEARNIAPSASFETFRTQLELQSLALGGMATTNQQIGAQSITPGAANPAIGSYENNARFTANGFRAERGTINWYVKISQGRNLPTERLGNLTVASGAAVQRYPLAPGEMLYSAGSGPSATIPLWNTGIYQIIAEQVDQGGNRTGAVATYRQVVISQAQGEQLASFNAYKSQVDQSIEAIEQGKEVAVQAAYTRRSDSGSVALTMYIGPSSEERGVFALVDLTPGATKRKFTGANTQACVDAFNENNTYPDGRISLNVPQNSFGVAPGAWGFNTDGASMLESLSSGLGWASLGFAAAGIVASFIPGGQVVAPFLFIASAASGAGSGAASLADRFSNATVDAGGVTLDLLTIASSIIGGAAAFRAMRAGAASLQLSRGGQFLLYSGLAVDGASALVFSVEGYESIVRVLDSSMSRGEKIGAITRIIASIAVTGGLYALGVREIGAQRRAITNILGDQVAGAANSRSIATLGLLDDVHLRAIRNVPSAEINDLADLIATDIAKARMLLALSTVDNITQFRTLLQALDANSLATLSRVLDPAYVAALSETMRPRYQRFLREVADGTISAAEVQQHIAVLAEVQTIRTGLRNQLGDAADEALSIGQRNIAYGSFDITLPQNQGQLNGDFVSVSGRGASSTITDAVGNNFQGRRVVPDVDNNHRVFSPTEGRAAHDSERKLMEFIMDEMERQIQAATGNRRFRFNGLNSYAGQGYAGSINIYSEMLPCNSCADILQTQFRAMFGGDITLNIRWGVTYP